MRAFVLQAHTGDFFVYIIPTSSSPALQKFCLTSRPVTIAPLIQDARLHCPVVSCTPRAPVQFLCFYTARRFRRLLSHILYNKTGCLATKMTMSANSAIQLFILLLRRRRGPPFCFFLIGLTAPEKTQLHIGLPGIRMYRNT